MSITDNPAETSILTGLIPSIGKESSSENIWIAGDIAPQTAITVVIEATVNNNITEIIENTATVTYNGVSNSMKVQSTSENANFIIGLVKDLQLFSKRDFFIVANSQIGLISGNILIPLNIFLKETKSIHQGTIPIKMKGSATLPLTQFEIVEKVLNNMNIVLNNLVPDLKISIKALGKELNKESEEVMRFQLMSIRKDKTLCFHLPITIK